MYKVGNYIVCKQNIDFPTLVIDKRYRITAIYVANNNNDFSFFSYIVTIMVKGKLKLFNITDKEHSLYLYKYFYSKQDERKLKLEKISKNI